MTIFAELIKKTQSFKTEGHIAHLTFRTPTESDWKIPLYTVEKDTEKVWALSVLYKSRFDTPNIIPLQILPFDE